MRVSILFQGSCVPNPCQHNGACEEKSGVANCRCKSRHKGRYCHIGRLYKHKMSFIFVFVQFRGYRFIHS